MPGASSFDWKAFFTTFVFYCVSFPCTFPLTPFRACELAEVRSRTRAMASGSCRSQGRTSKMHHQSRQIVSIYSISIRHSPFPPLRHFVDFIKISSDALEALLCFCRSLPSVCSLLVLLACSLASWRVEIIN